MSAGHVTSPIKLTSGVLNITENVTIDGPASGLAIDGGKNGAHILDLQRRHRGFQ